MLDTHEFIKALKTAGFPEIQAETLVEQLKKSEESSFANLATKRDIEDVRRDMKELELRLTGEMTLLKWMIGFVLAGIVSLILKAFFV